MSDVGVETRQRDAGISVRSLLIPLNDMTMLVPNALVSEVATLGEIAEISGGSPWRLGTIAWRGLSIPLISFERMLGGVGGLPGRSGRAIVFNTLNGNHDLPFLALVSQRIPRLLLVTERMLQRVEGASSQEGVLIRLTMQGEEVVVPDLDYLEKSLVNEGVKTERIKA